ncbi:hypothetical protein H5410_016535 [Solanum commersonii]|uniref:Uncharacterized protein n=1 Tax=Solanum commersonii TaxID=4109 RepID=A0A9J5ZXY2_SOLCO|nr:hypothetical protein H5410_016535 [Solanum commersonii]
MAFVAFISSHHGSSGIICKRQVLQNSGRIPWACRDMFWNVIYLPSTFFLLLAGRYFYHLISYQSSASNFEQHSMPFT